MLSRGKLKMSYQCDYCTDKTFAIKGWLDRHVRTKHPNLDPLQKQVLEFTCESCKSIVPDKDSIESTQGKTTSCYASNERDDA